MFTIFGACSKNHRSRQWAQRQGTIGNLMISNSVLAPDGRFHGLVRAPDTSVFTFVGELLLEACPELRRQFIFTEIAFYWIRSEASKQIGEGKHDPGEPNAMRKQRGFSELQATLAWISSRNRAGRQRRVPFQPGNIWNIEVIRANEKVIRSQFSD